MPRDRNTAYLRRPDDAPKATTNGTRDVVAWFHRHRYQLIPYYGTMAWYALADVVGRPVPVLLACTGTAIAAYWYGDKAGTVGARYLRLERSRRYVACTALVLGAWYAWACWSGDPSGRSVLVLVLAVALLAGPWWYRHRLRGSLPVTFHESIDRRTRQRRLKEVTALMDDWAGLTSAAQLQGSKLIAVEFTQWSILLHLRFRRGVAVEHFTVLRVARLESAFDARRKSTRMEPVQASAQQAIVRIMFADPHAHPIPLPDDDELTLGLFETGDLVEFELINTLIVGQLGMGKSGLINALMCRFMRNPKIAVIGVDMKPGAVELGRYAPVMDTLAQNPRQVDRVLDKYLGEMKRRGDIMRERGIRTWEPTEQDPFIVFMVDETWAIKRAKLDRKLGDATALGRAFAGCVVLVTQHPTNPNVPGDIKANTPQKIATKTENPVADRVAFGDHADKQGWRASSLIPANREGSFLIRSKRYHRPLLARAFWVDDARADAEVARWAPYRTTINWGGGAESDSQGFDTVSLDKESQDIVDADLVDDSAPWDGSVADPVLDAVRDGLTNPKMIAEAAGVSSASVYRHLGKLRDAGLVVNPVRGVWKPAA